MLLYMARHGETQWNRLKKTQGAQDTPLTDLGRYQASQLARRLKDNSITTIYTSDLGRARETAQIIGDRLNLVPIATSSLREVCFGIWEGLSIEEIEEEYPGELARWRTDLSFAPKEGESLFSVNNRIQNFIESLKIASLNPDNNILIISHAATIKILILELLEIPINLLTKIKISQTGLSLLKMEENNNAMMYMNDTCHIDIQF